MRIWASRHLGNGAVALPWFSEPPSRGPRKDAVRPSAQGRPERAARLGLARAGRGRLGPYRDGWREPRRAAMVFGEPEHVAFAVGLRKRVCAHAQAPKHASGQMHTCMFAGAAVARRDVPTVASSAPMVPLFLKTSSACPATQRARPGTRSAGSGSGQSCPRGWTSARSRPLR